MGFTGSLVENRISIGIPAMIRQALFDEARLIGLPMPELIRTILLDWYRQRGQK